MPRYHFDLEGDLTLFRDGKGSDLLDDQTAQEAALLVLGDIVRIMVASRVQDEVKTLVRNQVGTVVFGVKLSLVYS